MYLSRLELHGFKSFATRTVVEFSPGITVVVGPNGCGKSNIVDAVRWVIGEQRARILRSSKMENVIFNGTARRRPLGMAEVMLTIENTRGVLPTEYTEVTLGRRLYRSGESEYLLNGVPCRLRDITDLFMDTGMGAGAYSVIELKMIEDILSENAHDRRHLFEEAAGITKYKLRRAQTLRKLDGTQVDLTRLRDLVEELEKRVRSLKRQAARAERYQAQEARLHTLELALARAEYDRLRDREQTLEEALAALRDRGAEHQARLAQAEAELEAVRTRHIEQEQALLARQAALQAHLDAVRALEADRRLEAQRLETTRRDLERTRLALEEAARRRATLTQTERELATACDEARPAVEAAEAQLAEARQARDEAVARAEAARTRLNDLRQAEQRAAALLAERRRHLDRLAARREWLEQEQARLDARAEALDADAAGREARLHEVATQEAEARAAVEAARRALAEAEALRAAHAEALEAAREARRQAERRRDAAAAEVQLLGSLLASYEDLDAPLRHLAATSGWSDAPLQTVADVLGCAEEHRPVLAAALGPWAGCVVVATEAEAHRAMDRLRADGQGAATFIILERLKGVSPAAAPAGARPLAALVEAAPPFAALATALLHEAWLVPDLATASALAAATEGPARFFTPEGAWVDARGAVHGGGLPGGGSPAAARLGRRAQLEEARETLARLDAALAEADAAVAAAREALEAVPYEEARDRLAAAERALAEVEKAQARLLAEAEAHARRRAEVEARREALREEHDAAEQARAPREAEVAEAEALLQEARDRLTEADAAFREADAESRAALGRHNEARVAALEARNRLDNLTRDLARTREALAALDRQDAENTGAIEALEARHAALEDRLAALDEALRDRQAQHTGLAADVDTAKDALMQTKATISDLEARLRDLRREREHDLRQENQHEVSLAEVRTRATDLLAHVEETFGRSLLEEPVPFPDDFEETAARAEVQRLRAALRAMGPVNALALEAYEEENTRLQFLTEQLRDLEDAEATLLDTIKEINTTASARFHETFEAIRENFMRLFAELFGDDATADLSLADPDDPLESPIVIMAQPRGKRPSTLAQLSGGEKTLTAIALLFAIYLVKPSPFCILDEVDAPLDDANIDRFMKLIRSFADTTQFILVTHNKRTMEAADRMYGITMQEQGVSQLVGVKFDEALALAEE